MSFDFATLERRVKALESANQASLRFGRVTEIKDGKVRVQLRDGQSVVSHLISTLQSRVLKDQDIKMPDIDEPVACLFSGQGHEEGVMLGAYYNEREKDPKQPPTHDYKRYADGTEVYYDREAHKLQITVPSGEITIQCGGSSLVLTDDCIRLKSARIELN